MFSTHQQQRRRILQAMGAAALPLGLLSCSGEEKANALVVGGLPVTCNLTLSVACEARAAANKASPGFAFEYSATFGQAVAGGLSVAGLKSAAGPATLPYSSCARHPRPPTPPPVGCVCPGPAL